MPTGKCVERITICKSEAANVMYLVSETLYAPEGFNFRQEVEIDSDDEDLPDVGPPLMVKVLDGACGQNTIEVKLKHRRTRCPAWFLQGDTTKKGQPNDQCTNRDIKNFFRKGVGR